MAYGLALAISDSGPAAPDQNDDFLTGRQLKRDYHMAHTHMAVIRAR